MSIETLEKVCNALRNSVGDLLNEEENELKPIKVIMAMSQLEMYEVILEEERKKQND